MLGILGFRVRILFMALLIHGDYNYTGETLTMRNICSRCSYASSSFELSTLVIAQFSASRKFIEYSKHSQYYAIHCFVSQWCNGQQCLLAILVIENNWVAGRDSNRARHLLCIFIYTFNAKITYHSVQLIKFLGILINIFFLDIK